MANRLVGSAMARVMTGPSARQRHHPVLARRRRRHAEKQGRVDGHAAQVDRGVAVGLRDHLRDLLVVDQAEGDEGPGDRAPVLAGLGVRLGPAGLARDGPRGERDSRHWQAWRDLLLVALAVRRVPEADSARARSATPSQKAAPEGVFSSHSRALSARRRHSSRVSAHSRSSQARATAVARARPKASFEAVTTGPSFRCRASWWRRSTASRDPRRQAIGARGGEGQGLAHLGGADCSSSPRSGSPLADHGLLEELDRATEALGVLAQAVDLVEVETGDRGEIVCDGDPGAVGVLQGDERSRGRSRRRPPSAGSPIRVVLPTPGLVGVATSRLRRPSVSPWPPQARRGPRQRDARARRRIPSAWSIPPERPARLGRVPCQPRVIGQRDPAQPGLALRSGSRAPPPPRTTCGATRGRRSCPGARSPPSPVVVEGRGRASAASRGGRGGRSGPPPGRGSPAAPRESPPGSPRPRRPASSGQREGHVALARPRPAGRRRPTPPFSSRP